MIIYKVQNLITGKVYIGQTRNSLTHRQSQHYREAKSKKDNNYFHNALLHYQKSDFDWSVLCECFTEEDLNNKEIFYIAQYNATNKELGYNRKFGGEQGLCSDETKAIIGKHTKELWENPETAEKMLAGLRKGTETIKLKAAENFIICVCEICGCDFSKKPYSKKRTCNTECAKQLKINNSSIGLQVACKINKETFNDLQEERKEKIMEWSLNHKELFINLKLNKLSFLNDLADYLGISDMRTLTKVLNETSRKQFALKLKSLIFENVC